MNSGCREVGGEIGDGVILKASCCSQQPVLGCCLFVPSCQGNVILQTGSRQTRLAGQVAQLLNSSPAFVPDQVVAVPLRRWLREPFSWKGSPEESCWQIFLPRSLDPSDYVLKHQISREGFWEWLLHPEIGLVTIGCQWLLSSSSSFWCHQTTQSSFPSTSDYSLDFQARE